MNIQDYYKYAQFSTLAYVDWDFGADWSPWSRVGPRQVHRRHEGLGARLALSICTDVEWKVSGWLRNNKIILFSYKQFD